MSNFTPDLRQERDELREQLRAANERIAELETLAAPGDTGEGPQSRDRLLARIAGNVAGAGDLREVSIYGDAAANNLAHVAVKVARAILAEIGL